MKNNVRHSKYYFRHVNDNIIISCHNDSTIHYITIHYRYIKVKKEIKFFAICTYYIYFFFSFSFPCRNRQRNRMTFESIDSWWMRNTKAKDRKKKIKNKKTWGQNNDKNKIAQLVRDFNCLNSISCFLPRNKKIAWSNNPREISCTRIIRKWKIVNYNLPDISWMSEREKNLQQLCLDI